MKQTKWLGHEIDENGIKPNDEKVEAIIKLNPPENTKKLKSFLGAIQYMAKYLPKLSEIRVIPVHDLTEFRFKELQVTSRIANNVDKQKLQQNYIRYFIYTIWISTF